MQLTRQSRASLAWTLYLSVLLGLFACGLHHGQASGWALSGLSGNVCGSLIASGQASTAGDTESLLAGQISACALCSSFSQAPVDGLASGLDYSAIGRHAPTPLHSSPRPLPRRLLPSLNPRASPGPMV